MVIISCLSVCLQKKGKLQTLMVKTSYWQTSYCTRNKTYKKLLLKPFDYNVMTIYIPHSYYFQTWEHFWGQLHTSNQSYYCIMTITSKTLHQIKYNWNSPAIRLRPIQMSNDIYIIIGCYPHVLYYFAI